MEWTLQYVGGSSCLLYTPLSDGTQAIDRDVPIKITDAGDYNRLMASPHQDFRDVTKYPEPAQAPKPAAPAVSTDKDADSN